jgi:hypothetical protein
VELIKHLGFNGVRMHQKAEDPRFLYWCDRLGLLVSVEMPSPWLFSQRAAARTTVEWLEILQRDYSHPSVAMWVPFNESWGVMEISRSDQQRSFVLALYHLTRTQDPTRPVIGNDGWEHVAADIWTIHDYAMVGSALQERYGDGDALARTVRDVQPAEHRVSVAGVTWSGQPVVLSEFGGISYNSADVAEIGWAYAKVRDAESFLAKYEELVGAVLQSTALAGFCYTQLADMEQERNGILDEHRRAKVDPATIAEINRRPSRSMPAELITYNVLTHADVSPPPT